MIGEAVPGLFHPRVCRHAVVRVVCAHHRVAVEKGEEVLAEEPPRLAAEEYEERRRIRAQRVHLILEQLDVLVHHVGVDVLDAGGVGGDVIFEQVGHVRAGAAATVGGRV